jgi:hypothetical protein
MSRVPDCYLPGEVEATARWHHARAELIANMAQALMLDSGGVPRELLAYLAPPQASGRVLIPGCGSAYEAVTFHQVGHKGVAIWVRAVALRLGL